MDWLRKILTQVGSLWGKWSLVQKIILVGIVAVVGIGIAAMVSVSSTPTMVSVIDAPIRDEAARDRILTRINEEGIKATVTAAGVVQVADDKTAQRIRGILIREDLIPQGTDPWAIFDRERWTITDFERNVNLQRAIRQMVTDHIQALDDVDRADVTIVLPKDELFLSEQNPVTASVIITPKPGSDIIQNRKKIEGVQKLLKFAIEGLKDDNITITDQTGLILNDFAGLAEWDRLTRIERENKMIRTLETQYRAVVLQSLQKTFTDDRVRDLNLKIDMDMSQKAIATEEFFPITIKPRTPGSPYDDSQLVESIKRSEATSSTKWAGTGFNPEGPAGVEGQTPPAYKDMSNLYGKVEQETAKINNEINSRKTQEERSPSIDRVTVSVNIDGTWKWKYDEKRNPVIAADGSIEREYTPVAPEILRAAQSLVQNSVGYSAARGDNVTVQNIQFDRSKQFQDEDAAYFRQKQMQTTIMVFLSGLAILLIAFILFRTISREIERRRRLEAEERARREEALRQQALMQAEEEGMDVSISVEERTRMELLESVANMAKEHPEDVAQLIRTWLLEE
ncbi:flagellar basal-body MS-ring/collar protein FliF [Leadbettera azotonutricia]|nr:flagellar basal-body MS-ring/collar protein FliF [Leadbettera azotonutricia]